MKNKHDFSAYVVGKHGIVKGVNIQGESCIIKSIRRNSSKPIEGSNDVPENQEITSMEWSDEAQNEILLGLCSKSHRKIQVYNTEQLDFTETLTCNSGKGNIVGIARLKKGYLNAVESGEVTLVQSNGEEEILVNAGSNLTRMLAANNQENIIATGGNENPFKVFDIHKKQNIFMAKNVPHDSLQLRVPVDVSDLKFLNNDKEVVTVSKIGNVRLYDMKAQRRPIMNFQVKEEALTALAVCSNDHEVIFGSGKGKMNLIDLRKSKNIVSTYKGAVGAVTAIGVSTVQPLIVSTSLDRNLYVHDKAEKKLLKKVYLTSKLVRLAVRSEFSLLKEESDIEELEEIEG